MPGGNGESRLAAMSWTGFPIVPSAAALEVRRKFLRVMVLAVFCSLHFPAVIGIAATLNVSPPNCQLGFFDPVT
jgi:hypothetical protein